MKKSVVALVAFLVVVLVGGAVFVRSLVDPEHVRQMLERQLSAVLEQPVTIRGAEPSFWPRAGVTLTDVVVGQPAAITLARTEISTAMRALLSRRIEDAEVVIRDSELDLPLLLAALDRLSARGGTAADGGSGDAPGQDLPGGVTLVNVRAIELQNVRVRAGSRAAVFSMKSALDGDRLEIASASVASGVTSLKATGAVESLAARRARLSIAAESLDMDGLLVFAQEFARQARPAAGAGREAASGGATGPLDLTLAIEAARGSLVGVPFASLTATTHVTPGGVDIAPLALGLFGGRLEGAMHADLAGGEPVLAVKGSLGGVDMARLTEFAGQPGSVTGTLNGSLSATGRGADPSRALGSVRAQGAVEINDGTVKGLQLVRPIVLAFGKPNAAQPAEGGERFSRLSATYNLAGGVVSLGALAFESRDVELDGAGTLTIEGRTLDIKANARLSTELTAQAGRDLVRYAADDGRVTVPVTIIGPVDAPQVGVNIAGVAQRAVTNELKRRAEDAIRGVFGKKPPKQ